MAKIKRALDSWLLFILAAVWLCFFVGANMWPASAWLQVDRISVGNTLAGQPVPMVATRKISRKFDGRWLVTVRRWEYSGWVIYCNASGSANYDPAARLPKNLTLDWWTEGQCPLLPEGRYTVNTSWRINPALSFLPDKYVTADSNIFEVEK